MKYKRIIFNNITINNKLYSHIKTKQLKHKHLNLDFGKLFIIDFLEV